MAHTNQVTPFLLAHLKADDSIDSVDCGERMFGEGSKLRHQITLHKARYDYQLNCGGLPIKHGKYEINYTNIRINCTNIIINYTNIIINCTNIIINCTNIRINYTNIR